MRKILTGIAFAAIVLVGVATTALTLRAQQRSEEELSGAFAALRAALGSGSIGKVEVDLWKRTFKVSDIELQTDGTPRTTIKIREITATGIDFPADWRLSADRIEALDVEIAGTSGVEPAIEMAYKAPRITLTDYSGPMALLRPIDTSSALDVTRLVLEHIVASTATSITIPTLTATLTPSGPPALQPIGPVTYTYTDIGLRDIRDGRIADTAIERAQFTITTPPDALGKITGEGGRASTADFDAGMLLAVLDPGKSTDDRLLRLQGRTLAGPYSVRFENGGALQIGGLEVDTIAVRPAKLHIAELMELAEAIGLGVGSGPVDLGDETTEIANLMADFHEGINMGLFEVRGVSLALPQMPPFKLGALRLKGLAQGKLAELAVEGVEGVTPEQQRVKVGRLAFNGLGLANMARLASAFASGPPTSEKFAALAPLLEGIEIRDATVPYKQTRQTVEIERVAMSWGQFIGPIPTTARVSARLTSPFDAGDPDLDKLLAAADIMSVTADFELGAAWAEAARSFALSPVSLEFTNLFSLAARVSLGNVPRELFVVDPDAAMLAASQIEAGLVEFVLRDAGALDLAVAQYARQQGQPLRAARTALIENLKEAAAPLVAANPDLQPAVTAIAQFIETPKSALTIRVIPKGHVPIQSTLESALADPAAALAQFRIEVTTGR